MCCASDVTSETVNDFNALPANWASDRDLLAGLTVDDDDDHDDPVLRWPKAGSSIPGARNTRTPSA